MIANFRHFDKPDVVRHVCYIGAVVPATPERAQALLEMAKFATVPTPNNPRVRGAINYRAGNFEAAIADMEQSERVYPGAPGTGSSWRWPITNLGTPS